MREKAKTVLLALLSPKTLILGVAVYNCIVVWMASGSPGICWYCPWYWRWSFTNEPSRLIVAACCLRLGMRWGSLAAIGLSGFTLLQGISLYASVEGGWKLLRSFSELWTDNPMLSLHTQYLLASVILVYAVTCFIRSVSQRSTLYR